MDTVNEVISTLIRKEICDKRSYDLVKLDSERTYENKYGIGRQRIRTVINNLISEGLLVKNEGGATYILPELKIKNLYIIYTKDIRVSDPFYSDLWLHITTLSAKHGVHVKFMTVEDSLGYFTEVPVVVIGVQNPEQMERLQERFKYIVGIQTYLPDSEIIQIYFDNKKIGYSAVKTLLEYHHQNILCLAGPPRYHSANLRRAGFEKACNRFQINYKIFHDKMNWTGGYTAGEKVYKMMFKKGGPTAAFVANDWMAIGLIQYLKEHHVSVPNDFSVISVDNIPIAGQISPSLTTFSQDMSMLTAELFATVNQITPKTYDTMVYKKIVIPHILVTRQTLRDNNDGLTAGNRT